MASQPLVLFISMYKWWTWHSEVLNYLVEPCIESRLDWKIKVEIFKEKRKFTFSYESYKDDQANL